MWNTDAYNFQESTDPIYKSIPFLLTMRRAARWACCWTTPGAPVSISANGRTMRIFHGAEGAPRLLFALRPRPEASAGDSGLADRANPVAAAVVAGLSAIALQLRYGSRSTRYCKQLRADHIPADLILDIDFQLKNRPFTVDQEKFPNFVQMWLISRKKISTLSPSPT